jgi:hypothetical protein
LLPEIGERQKKTKRKNYLQGKYLVFIARNRRKIEKTEKEELLSVLCKVYRPLHSSLQEICYQK